MKLFRRLLYLFRQSHYERDLAEEIEFHREMTASPRAMGNLTLAREDARAVWIGPWIQSVWQDAAYAIRSLRRQPGFTLVALAALGTAIGLNTSFFTVFDAFALRPWPVKDPARVVLLFQNNHGFSPAESRYFAANSKTFTGIVATWHGAAHLGFEAFGKATQCSFVSGNYFDVLGVGMETGRGFLPDEDRLDAPVPVAVLSYTFWQDHFGGDPHIVGRQIRVEEIPVTVVGVASRDFNFAVNRDLWFPLAAMPVLQPSGKVTAQHILADPGACCGDVAGRLSPGVTRATAQAELTVLGRQFNTEFHLEAGKAEPRGVQLTGTAFFARPDSKRQVIPLLALMFLAVTLVLLLACANVGNLLIARASARQAEIQVRIALGAGRTRIVRQLLTESLILALAASSLGLLLAYRLPSFLLRRIDQAPPFGLAPDATVLAYTIALAVFACMCFGLAPALHGTRIAFGNKSGRMRLRSFLLSAQVAISVVLLIGASLLTRAVARSRALDPGFSIADVSVISLELPARAYDQARTGAFYKQLLKDLGATSLPTFGLAAREPLSTAAWINGPYEMQTVSPGYFDVLRIPILAGRNLEAGDAERHVILVNETMARREWPGESALGKSIPFNAASWQVIGVVKDTYSTRGGLERIEPMYYVPFTGALIPKLFVRATPGAAEAVAAVAAHLDPRVRTQAEPLQDSVERWFAPTRVGVEIAGMLGAFALVLATVGMAGVFAYAVQQRTKEIGIRMALGARPPQVVRLILAESSRAVLTGLALGLAGAIPVSRLMRHQLSSVSSFDALAYLGVAAILALAGLAASYAPVRRAARIDPITALRHD